MKDNKAKTKSTKKTKLLFWLTLAACLLIIAAIVVGVVFGTRSARQNLTIDNSTNQGDDNKGDQGQNPPDDDDEGDSVDTSSQYEFISPIEHVSLIKSHEFGYDRTMDWYKLHQAMDFGAEAGTPVLAAVDGTIKSVVVDDYLDYAIVEIAHANDLTTVYKFIDPDSNLKAGQKVNRGQVIGTVATASGRENADGEHLHFEVYKAGEITDPDDYLNLTTK